VNNVIILEELKKRLDIDFERHKFTGVGSYIHTLRCAIVAMIEKENQKIEPINHIDNETFMRN
jgi:hypothetical protein